MRGLVVVRPGMRTTVEDLGRRGTGAWGVPRGGAFDAAALAAANALVGNGGGEAGLELTLRAPELRATEAVDVAVVGADFGLEIEEAGTVRRLVRGRAERVGAGGCIRGGWANGGARAWLAVAGGIDVPLVLGSRSTETSARFGGFEGRALAAGDVLPVGAARGSASGAAYRDPSDAPGGAEAPAVLRVLPGPQLAETPSAVVEGLLSRELAVARDSDRTGVRLAPLDDALARGPAEIEPEGAVPGAVQVPPDGNPIVLGVDGPTTGGYAKPFVVIRADLGRLARLAPSGRVRLAAVSREEAVAAARESAARLRELAGA